MWGIIEEIDSVWYFDATGKLMPKYKDQQETLLYSLISHDSIAKNLIPIADFLSNSNDSLTIFCYLKKIIEKLKCYSFFKYPKVLVTDFSWANINASIRAFNNCETIDYLVLSFEIIINKNNIAITKINTCVYLCSTHLFKNVIEESEKILKPFNSAISKHVKKTFLNAFSLLQNSISIEEFSDILKCIHILFTTKYKTQEVLESIAKLDCLLLLRNVEWLRSVSIKNSDENQRDNDKEIFFIENVDTNLIRDSPFSSFFENIIISNKIKNNDEQSKENNAFFYPNLFDIIKKKLHLVPFWSGIMVNMVFKDKTRLSNNYVECWFKYFKNNILNINKRVRSTRLLYLSEISTPLYFYLNQKYKENYEDRANIKFGGYTNNKKNDEDKEMWSFKKPQKSSIGYHNMTLKIENYENEADKETILEKKLCDLNIDIGNQVPHESLETEIKAERKLEPIDESLKMDFETNDDQLKRIRNTENLIYFKINEFLISRSSLKRILSNEWLNDNVSFYF